MSKIFFLREKSVDRSSVDGWGGAEHHPLPDHLQKRVKYPQSEDPQIHSSPKIQKLLTKDKSFPHGVLPGLVKLVESAVKVYKAPRLKLYRGKIHRRG